VSEQLGLDINNDRYYHEKVRYQSDVRRGSMSATMRTTKGLGEEILKAAGLTSGALYSHFQEKETLS